MTPFEKVRQNKPLRLSIVSKILINSVLPIFTCISRYALTKVLIDAVRAVGPVLAGIGGALVSIVLAAHTCEAG